MERTWDIPDNGMIEDKGKLQMKKKRIPMPKGAKGVRQSSLAYERAKGNKRPGLIFLIPSLAWGGAEKIASILSPYLALHFDLTLALLENRISFPVPKGVRLVTFSGPLRSQAAHVTRIPHHLLSLIRLVRRHQVRVVMSFMEQANILNILAAAVTGHHAVISQHTARHKQSVSRGLLGRLILAISRRLYPKASHALAVSRGIRKILLADYGLDPNLITVMPNPIDYEAIAEQAAASPAFPLPPKFLLHVGRMQLAHKAHDVLLAAFHILYKKYPNLSLVLVGDGPDQKEIEDHTKSLGLGDAAMFAGWQSNVASFMARAQALILCSRHEGWPTVLVEAMACGCPVVATDCLTGPREILGDNEYGILVPVDFPEALSQAVQRILENKSIRAYYQKKGRRRAQDFDLERIGSKYTSLLKKTMKYQYNSNIEYEP